MTKSQVSNEIDLDFSDEEEDEDSSSSSESSSDDDVVVISDDDDENNENPLKRKFQENSKTNNHQEENNEINHQLVVVGDDDDYEVEEVDITEIEAKRRRPNLVNNSEKYFFQYIPLYQMRIIVSYLDLNSILKFSQTCSYLRSEYLMRKEFWQGLDEMNFLPTISNALVFDSSTSSTLGMAILSNISLPISNFTTLRSFFSIYLEHFPFLVNVTRLVLDFEKYMYISLERNDIQYLAESFTELCDLQLLNIKFKDVSNELRIIKEFLAQTNVKRLKISFFTNDANQNLSFIANQGFNEFISSLNSLESLHFGFNKRGNITCYEFSKNELLAISNQLGTSLKSFGCQNITIEDFVNTFFQIEREEVLPQMEEILIGGLNCIQPFNLPTIPRNNLTKMVIEAFRTKEARDIQKILNNLPNLQYLNVSIIRPDSNTEVDGKVILKSNSLKQLRFINYPVCCRESLVQLDLPNIEKLILQNFGELMVLSELKKLQNLRIANSFMFNGHLNALLGKCSDSLTEFRIRDCFNIRSIHILKDPYVNNFVQLRTLKISSMPQLEKVSIACVGLHLIENNGIVLEKLSLKHVKSLREFSFELGDREIYPQIRHIKLSNCNGLRSMTPEPMMHTFESLFYYGDFESPLWTYLSNQYENMKALKKLHFHIESNMKHISSVRMSRLLMNINNLEEFGLSSRFSNDSFVFNIDHKNLRRLEILLKQATDVKFSIFAPLLESLNITYTSYVYLKSNLLKDINATNCEIKELVVQNEAKENAFSSVHSLTLRSCNIVNFRQSIPLFKNLKRIAIHEGKVGPKFQEVLSELSNLESLTFDGEIPSINILPSMRVLSMNSGNVKSIIIPEGSNSLIKMNVSSCTQLTQLKFQSKKSTLPYLAIVDIRGTSLNEKSIKTLVARSPNLKNIRASNVPLDKDLGRRIRKSNQKASFESF
ncbi:predicted protein [Naegleria gruberi]|uniref:Predicted protein n=1 Tax=Naegleria gruberi TaxID=5762 RepID=D2VRD5_NAEGR|nr:uncharacterized protein NAEGRDRAFT_51653 [Naegleria gruberi]EFC40651.1 predicted protein [Naegleria gruberi]|eukprot:XP_002673395.1 predicted protein [Naegleria gruberi strain NEG-M]